MNSLRSALSEGNRTAAYVRGLGYRLSPEQDDVLKACESGAEGVMLAYLFAAAAGVVWKDEPTGALYITTPQLTVRPQHRVKGQRMDMLVELGDVKIAVEIEGSLAPSTKELEDAALRQRRLVALGYVVVRFLARECLERPGECWNQVEAILRAHSAKVVE